jgi:hypothetical protein
MRMTINVMMCDRTWENGPIRHIPGAQAPVGGPPAQADEPEWMRFSTLVGALAGAGVFRAPCTAARRPRDPRHAQCGIRWEDLAAFKAVMPHEIWRDHTPKRSLAGARRRRACGRPGPG